MKGYGIYFAAQKDKDCNVLYNFYLLGNLSRLQQGSQTTCRAGRMLWWSAGQIVQVAIHATLDPHIIILNRL